MAKKTEKLVRYKEIVEKTDKLNLIPSIQKAIAEYCLSKLVKSILNLHKDFKLNDIEYHGKEIYMIFSSAKKDNSFVTIKNEVVEEVNK